MMNIIIIVIKDNDIIKGFFEKDNCFWYSDWNLVKISFFMDVFDLTSSFIFTKWFSISRKVVLGFPCLSSKPTIFCLRSSKAAKN